MLNEEPIMRQMTNLSKLYDQDNQIDFRVDSFPIDSKKSQQYISAQKILRRTQSIGNSETMSYEDLSTVLERV